MSTGERIAYGALALVFLGWAALLTYIAFGV